MAEKINNLREIFPPAYRVIQLEKFLIKNITASYDKLKLLIKDTIANEKVTKRKEAYNKSDTNFSEEIKSSSSSFVKDLTQNTMKALSEDNLNSLKRNYDNEVEELAKKEKKEKDYEELMRRIEAENAEKGSEPVSPNFTKEEEEYMLQLTDEQEEQEKENDESRASYETHKGKTNSTKLDQEDPRSDISTKTGDFEDIEEGEEDEFDKENNEILKYKYKKRRNKENNTLTYETIPFKTITNTFERRFQTMPITEINRIMEQEINEDHTEFKVYNTNNDGIFEYQYMKTTNFECINIIEAEEEYGEKLLKNITGDRIDIQQIMEDFINNINKPELKNINKQELKVPKARIYLRYIGEDMELMFLMMINGDSFHWRAYSINPLNSQINKN